VSVYGATVAVDPWVRLDDVVFQHTEITATTGTECVEPDFSALAGQPAMAASAASGLSRRGTVATVGSAAAASEESWEGVTTGPAPTPVLERTLDLRAATRAAIAFESRATGGDGAAELLASVDGLSWQTVGAIPAPHDSVSIAVDLSAYAGHVVHLRVVLRAASGAPPIRWIIERLRVLAS
jgi:hypothetical protein